MKKLVKNKQPIRAARASWVVTFSELTPEQQEKAIELAGSDRRLSDIIQSWFDEDIMDGYRSNVIDLASDLTAKTGIAVNVDMLYWGSSSQGPYPEWNLSDVFESYVGGDGDIEYEMSFGGKSTDVIGWISIDLYMPNEDGDYTWDYGYDCDEVRSSGVDSQIVSDIMSKANAAQDFIDKVWELIRDVCWEYPDEEWIRETMEANDFEFYVDDDTISYAG